MGGAVKPSLLAWTVGLNEALGGRRSLTVLRYLNGLSFYTVLLSVMTESPGLVVCLARGPTPLPMAALSWGSREWMGTWQWLWWLTHVPRWEFDRTSTLHVIPTSLVSIKNRKMACSRHNSLLGWPGNPAVQTLPPPSAPPQATHIWGEVGQRDAVGRVAWGLVPGHSHLETASQAPSSCFCPRASSQTQDCLHPCPPHPPTPWPDGREKMSLAWTRGSLSSPPPPPDPHSILLDLVSYSSGLLLCGAELQECTVPTYSRCFLPSLFILCLKCAAKSELQLSEASPRSQMKRHFLLSLLKIKHSMF